MAEGNPQDSTVEIDQNLSDKELSDTECFVDIFDILNNDDAAVDIDVDNITEEYNEDFDLDYTKRNVDEEEMVTMIEDDDDDDIPGDKIIMEEQILSQKLSQLSTKDTFNIDDNKEEYSASRSKKRQLSTPSTPPDVIPFKRSRSTNADDNMEHLKDNIPKYLQQSANQFFKQILNGTITTITVEDLRQFAILKHKIVDTNLRKQLWTIYLKAGTGQWETHESSQTSVDRRLWPMHVKKLVPSRINLIDRNQIYNEHKICETIVHEYLEEFKHTIEQYQNEFNRMKNSLPIEIVKKVEKFVQRYGVRPLQMSFNHKMTILECNYDAEILEREFLRLQPTEFQIQHTQRLYDLRFKYVEAKQKLIELKQRILCNKPSKSMYSGSISTYDIDSLRNDDDDQIRRTLQEKLTDSMIAAIIQAEDTIHEYRQLFDEENLQLSVLINADDDEEERNLMKLIDRHLKIIDKKLHSTYTFRINSFLRNYSSSNTSQEDLEEEQIDRWMTFGFSPSLILDTSLHHHHHQLTEEQLKILNRGPTYIPPCQMYVTPSYVSIKDMLEKQHTLLKHNLSILFAKFQLNPAKSIFIQNEIKEAFINMFSNPIPLPLYQRALYEKQIIKSIRQHLKNNHLILRRTANQQNIFYLGHMKDFQDKANEYMSKMDIFEVVANEIIDPMNLQQTHESLTQIMKSMNTEFEILFNNRSKHRDFLNKLYVIDLAKIQLPYLYFLPDVSSSKNEQQNLSLKPVIGGSQRSITSQLSQFLDKLLRPVIQRNAKPITFVDGADFLRKFNQYITDGKHHLRPTTLFATIKIPNFNTLVSHGTMLIALKDFLQTLGLPDIENISIGRIIRLTAIFLHNNRFYYENKIYRFSKGSPNSFPLTETLSNIYVYQWERQLVPELSRRNQFYGRCKDQIYFTWNQTINEFHEIFQAPDFAIDIQIDFKIQFLNIYLQNLDGTLYSCVYHDPNIPKYTLPYVIGDATVAHSHWLRSALIRAVRYCTSVFDFNHERIYLEITYLANGYSLKFIEQRIQHFYKHFDATSLRSSLDQNVYDKLRHRLFNFISEQHRLSALNQALENSHQRIQLTYLYQFGPKDKFEKKLREILLKHLNKSTKSSSSSSSSSAHKPLKIILRTKQQYSLNALLSQQKPSHPLLNGKMIRF